MISSLHGVVLHTTPDQVVIEVGGVGFSVAVPTDVAHTATVGELLQLHTSLIVREDSLALYGFAERDELEIFGLLISVTGVGPKSALGVLSHLTVDQIAEAVTSEDDAPFRRVSGIGPKTAKLIVLQLAGKVHPSATPQRSAASGGTDVVSQVALGCTNAETATRLSIKPETVKAYLRSAMRKLEAHSRHEAVVRSRSLGIIP